MYAVLHLGGKQYRVQLGGTFKVDFLEGEVGQPIQLEKVSMIVDKEKVLVGKPWVEGAKITATVLEQGRDRKIIVATYKAKTNFHRKAGHRQDFTNLRVDGIEYPGKEGEE